MNGQINNFIIKIISEDGLARNTAISYQKDLELFNNFCINHNINLPLATEDNIRHYIELLNQQQLSSSSIARKIACLKSFYRFLLLENTINESPLINIKQPKYQNRIPNFLSEEEVFKLLKIANQDDSDFSIKTATILELIYSSGLRVSELVSIKIGDLQIANRDDKDNIIALHNYLIIKGKGNKERLVPIGQVACQMLLKYLKLRNHCGYGDSHWLFTGTIRASRKKFSLTSRKQQNSLTRSLEYSRLTHLTRQRVNSLFKELAIKAGIDKSRVHPHIIRHSFATHLLNRGIDLRVLQEILGHNSISTTEIYTHIADDKLQELVKRYHPLTNYQI
jgi:integrase/recombinase XerD